MSGTPSAYGEGLVENVFLANPLFSFVSDEVHDFLAYFVLEFLSVTGDLDLLVFVEWVAQTLALLEVEEVFAGPGDFDDIFPLAGPALRVHEDTVYCVFGDVDDSGDTLESS